MIDTWHDLGVHLTNRYPMVAAFGPTAFTVQVSASSGRKAVGIRQLVVAGDAAPTYWLELVTKIMATDRIGSAMRLLCMNAELAIGSLCIFDQAIALRHTLPSAGLVATELDRALGELALQARRIAAQLGHSIEEGAPFGHFSA